MSLLVGKEEDDHDFVSSGSSKLASLFDTEVKKGNEKLTYTAPKQPKDVSLATSSTGVVCASAVVAFKYVQDKHVSQGRVGAALIGNQTAKDFKLLLYVTREQPLTFVKVTAKFTFHIQPNNYLSFHDDMSVNWSLLFDSDTDLASFTRQVVALKFFCAGSSSVITQDLNQGEGQSVQTGDLVELSYSGWLLDKVNVTNKFIDVSDKVRCRLGAGKIIKCLDEGVVGMRKSSQRILAVPSSLTAGLPDLDPPNSPVVIQVRLLRVKVSKDITTTTTSAAAVVVKQKLSTDDDVDDDDYDDDVDGNIKVVKSDKAKLLKRMARMGQPILPVLDDEKSTTMTLSMKPTTAAKPFTGQPHSPQAAMNYPQHHLPHAAMNYPTQPHLPQTAMNYPTQLHHPQTAMNYPTQPHHSTLPSQPFLPQNVVGYPSQMWPSPAGAVTCQQLAVYQPLTSSTMVAPAYSSLLGQMPTSTQSHSNNDISVAMETSHQTTEIRLSLNRLQDKVDRLMEKVDTVHSQQSFSLVSSLPNMDSKLLLHNIERLVFENDRLKKDLVDKSEQVELQSSKISELLQQNHKFVEQSNSLLEERNNSYKMTATQSQNRIMTLEQEKSTLASQLADVMSQLTTSQLNVTALKKTDADLEQQVERLQSSATQLTNETKRLQSELSVTESKRIELQEQLREKIQEKRQLQNNLNNIEETLTDTYSEKLLLNKNLSERKRKFEDSMKTHQQEMEELKINHQQEIHKLKEKLKMNRTETETSTAQQISEVEEELNQSWKEKCDRLLTSVNERHQLTVNELHTEKTFLQNKLETVKLKLSEAKSHNLSLEQQLLTQQPQADDKKFWQDKYNTLYTQSSNLKVLYEDRLRELKETTTPHNSINDDLLLAEIKKIMNGVYQKLKQEFSDDETYEGDLVRQVIMNVIKLLMKMILIAMMMKRMSN